MENSLHKQFEKVDTLVHWKRYKEALEVAEEALRNHPEEPNAYALISHIYGVQDQNNKCLHWNKEALRRDPANKLAWLVRTRLFYEAEDWKNFEETVTEALKYDAEEDEYYFYLGNMYNRKGKKDKAKQYLEMALDLEPENAMYLATYSYILAMVKEDTLSKQTEERALQLDPENTMVLLHVAWAADTRKQHKTSLAYLESAIRLDPNNAQIRQEYMQILQKQYLFYRIFLVSEYIRRWKRWQIILFILFFAILLRRLWLLIIIMHYITHWISRALVNKRVFGKFIVKV